MDKMTDAKIRSWLKKNSPDLLAAHKHYQEAALADFPFPEDGAPSGPEPLRIWMENRHPNILAQIPLW